ncbi:MAG: LacI family DNA-binding transcriptional regulator, partial [Spirochaetota bacterium]
MSSKQVTIKDIAALAGVSFSTVSRCLNNSPLVAEKTRERVVKIAEELHFEFNASARGLITSKVGTVGIVLPEHYTQLHVNGYHSMLVNSLRTNLEMHDVDMMVTYQKNHYTGGNNIIRLVTRGKVDGLIILAEKLDEITLSFLEERQIPCVFGHYPPSKLTEHQDTVFTDHYVGGRLVAEHLLERGYASCTLLEVSEPHLEFELRAQGFCDALEGRAEVKRFACQSHFVSSRRTVTDHMDEISSTRAIFCLNDLMAFGAIRALKD